MKNKIKLSAILLGVPAAAIVSGINSDIFINSVAKAGTINLNGHKVSVNITNQSQVETSPGFF
jgi:hypothetical protein